MAHKPHPTHRCISTDLLNLYSEVQRDCERLFMPFTNINILHTYCFKTFIFIFFIHNYVMCNVDS